VTRGVELRIALGMRGGVSLAVWIGGACREIDALRRAGEDAAGGFWTRVRDLGRIDAVTVDVIAGASAGGLNGVIFAASQAYGFSTEALRDAWLDLGDLKRLVRAPEEGDGPPSATSSEGYPSLLWGDGYFFAKTYETLRELAATGAAVDAPRPRVDLTLTATLVEPVSRPGGPGDAQSRRHHRFASTFRFRNHGPGWLSDFPPADRPQELEAALARLALAARATSSFPVAFEAAAVHALRPPSFSGDLAPTAGDVTVDMASVFGDASSDGAPFVVIDGGVLDNIPLGHAVAAVADTPADRPTRRVLVYVRPGAPGVEERRAAAGDRRGTWSVVQGIVRAKIPPETIAGDLALIEEHNRLVERTRRLRFLAFSAVPDRDALRDRACEAEPAYLVQRADAEAQEIHRLLNDPVAVLGDDPFPAAPGVEDDVWRTPVVVWDEDDLVRLDATLAEEICGRLKVERMAGTRSAPLAFGIGPLQRLTLLLLEWARFVKEWGGAGDPARAGLAKQKLYRVLLLHREVMARPRQLAWVVLAATRRPSYGDWEKDAANAVEGLLSLTGDQAESVRAYLDGGDERVLAPVRRDVLARVDGLLGGRSTAGTEPPGAGATPDLRGAVMQALVSVATTLAGANVPAQLLAVDREAADAASYLHVALAGAPPTAEDLCALEILAFPEAILGAPGRRAIEFVELSSAGATPISGAFPRLLLRHSEGPRAWSTIAERLLDAPPITSDNKLAGNELNNFSAFLRRTWRANDWMWGRLDAVPTLVGLAVTPDAVVQAARRRLLGLSADTDAVDALVEDLRATVLGGAGVPDCDPETSWPVFLERTAWAQRAADIRRLAARAVEEAGKGPDGPVAAIHQAELAPLVDALVSVRQWEVVAEELALQRRDARGDARATAAPLGPRQAVEAADRYLTGVQTLTDPRDPGDWELIGRLVPAARRMAQENLADRVPVPLFAGLQAVGAILGWSWLGPRAGFKWTKAVATLLAVALLAVPVLGSSADGAARGWSATAVPGALAVVAGLAAGVAKRCVAAVMLVVVGGGLVLAAALGGGNWLGSAAVGAVAALVATGALWALDVLRPRPGR
jgi:patatin-related protein